MSVQEAGEVGFDVARVLALRDRDQAFDDHFAVAGVVRDHTLELGGDRQEQQVGRGDAVDGGGERGGDAVAELARIGQVLHHRDQAQHGTDDAERRRVDAHRLEDLGAGLVLVFLAAQFDFQHVPHRLRFDAVHQQLQALAQERVLLCFHLRFQAQQALAAGDVAPLDDLLDQLAAVAVRRPHDPAHDLERVLEHCRRGVQQDRGDGADDDDHERRRRPHRRQAGALEDAATDQRGQGEKESNEAESIHGSGIGVYEWDLRHREIAYRR
ncbi:hypothetical protein G6F31_012146 [Rhizopus arrhizus]|nr:hypothetical protein G6F31_012146 [Rhizopus arrhizus]